MLALKRTLCVLALGFLIACAPTALARAAQASSSSYSVDEVFFGNGGELNACSTSYCTKQALGENGQGNTSSANFQAQAGFNSNRNEYLEFAVNAGTINFGNLSTSSAKTGTATFRVKAYLANGYQVITASDPPAYAGHFFAGIASPTASTPGTEQFGINLKANTSPTTFGANPVQVPTSTYSFGVAATGYDTANVYKYVKGDTIASSSSSTGETDYTISYIMNISNSTQGGIYTMNHVLVATATF